MQCMDTKKSAASIYIIESTCKTELVSSSEVVAPVSQTTRCHLSEGSSQKHFHSSNRAD